jgi:hypothetical protein
MSDLEQRLDEVHRLLELLLHLRLSVGHLSLAEVAAPHSIVLVRLNGAQMLLERQNLLGGHRSSLAELQQLMVQRLDVSEQSADVASQSGSSVRRHGGRGWREEREEELDASFGDLRL